MSDPRRRPTTSQARRIQRNLSVLGSVVDWLERNVDQVAVIAFERARSGDGMRTSGGRYAEDGTPLSAQLDAVGQAKLRQLVKDLERDLAHAITGLAKFRSGVEKLFQGALHEGPVVDMKLEPGEHKRLLRRQKIRQVNAGDLRYGEVEFLSQKQLGNG